MNSEIIDQAKDLIDKSNNILIIPHAKMDGDTLSSAISMYLILKKLNKNPQLVCADPVPNIFSFLPNTQDVKSDFQSENKFIISLDCSLKKAKRVKWKAVDDKLHIYVDSDGENFTKNDVSFSTKNPFDLIITVDAADILQLGSVYTENKKLFQDTNILSFDHHASNLGFGNVNLIDSKASSTAEVIFNFLPSLLGNWKKHINEDIATLLLTGIITDTSSFQNANTTPRSLEVAAELSELGARQQEIIKNIFKTKGITTLRLWGRVLSKIQHDKNTKILWSTILQEDLIDTDANMDDTNGIIDELLSTALGMDIVFLVKEREDGVISVSLRSTNKKCDVAEIAKYFGGGGHVQAAGFKIRSKNPFDQIMGDIVTYIRDYQMSNQKEKQNTKDDSNNKTNNMTESFNSFTEDYNNQEKDYINEENNSLDDAIETEVINNQSSFYNENLDDSNSIDTEIKPEDIIENNNEYNTTNIDDNNYDFENENINDEKVNEDLSFDEIDEEIQDDTINNLNNNKETIEDEEPDWLQSDDFEDEDDNIENDKNYFNDNQSVKNKENSPEWL